MADELPHGELAAIEFDLPDLDLEVVETAEALNETTTAEESAEASHDKLAAPSSSSGDVTVELQDGEGVCLLCSMSFEDSCHDAIC